MRVRNIFGTRFSGALGKSLIASTWKGHEYIRTYTPPRNPRTENQQKHRAIFTEAVKVWHSLTSDQKQYFNKIADGMTGYNLFIGSYIKAVRNGEEPEIPIFE